MADTLCSVVESPVQPKTAVQPLKGPIHVQKIGQLTGKEIFLCA